MRVRSWVWGGVLCVCLGVACEGVRGWRFAPAATTSESQASTGMGSGRIPGSGMQAGATSRMKLGTATAARSTTLPASTRKSVVVKHQPFVETGPIVVTMKLMDPARGLKPREFHGEAGCCETKFGSNFGFENTPPEYRMDAGEFVASIRVQAPASKVSLGFELWLPEDANAWLVDHEETHRAISERVYKEGVVELSAFLKTVNGRVYEGRGKTKAAAGFAARKAVLDEFNEVYVRVLPGRQMKLNREFDRLSRHGIDQRKSAGELMKTVFETEKAATQPTAE